MLRRNRERAGKAAAWLCATAEGSDTTGAGLCAAAGILPAGIGTDGQPINACVTEAVVPQSLYQEMLSVRKASCQGCLQARATGD